MKASACSFDQMMTIRSGLPVLADRTSLMQVEYGIDDLQSSGYAFVDISDDCNLEFKSRKNICDEFGQALDSYIKYLFGDIPHEVG